MHRSTYTTCDPSQPVWKLSAPQIEVDNDEGFGTARNAVLRIGKVPVLWAPYFKFPIDDRRKTGLLFPQLGMSGRNGFDYTQPIYLNLAPNYDDTLMPRYMSRRGLMLDNEFRYLYNGGRGELLTAYIPNDKLRDRDRGRVMFSGYHNVDDHWQARANLAWVSDERYVEDFANRLVGVTASNLQSTVGLYGTGKNWTAGIMADRWQLTDYTLNESALPYNRQPRLYFNWDKPVLPWLETGVYAEAVRFTHDDINFKYDASAGPDLQYTRNGQTQRMYGGSRLDVKPYVSFPISGAAWYVTPTLAYRYTGYDLDQAWPTASAATCWSRRASTRTPPRRSSCAATNRPAAACRSAASTPACSSIARPPSAASRSCTRWNRACSTCARRTATRTTCRSSTPVTSPSAGASCSATRAIPAPTARTTPTS